MRREADRLAFRQAKERIANVDGAPWIRQQLELHLAELDGLGLDFYHLGENVHRARRAVFGEDSAEGKAWADQLMHCFKHDGYDAAWERLVPWRTTPARSPRKRQAANRLLEYVSARREMIRDPEFRSERLANRLRPHRSPMQTHGGPLAPLGSAQRRRHRRARFTRTEAANGTKTSQPLPPLPLNLARMFGQIWDQA